MFNHPEGQAHPRPPKNSKKYKETLYSEKIFGDAKAEIEIFLNKRNNNSKNNCLPLAKKVRDFIYNKNKRIEYVKYGSELPKRKNINSKNTYDIVLIGAGIHASVFVYTIKQINPNLKILVIEKDKNICSTFYKLGESLVLNSPTFTKVGLNSNIFSRPFHTIE